MNIRTTAIALLLTATAGFASAHAPAATPGVDAAQHRQSQRIAQGVASGELTRVEAHRLRHEQHDVAVAERMAKADGVVTPAERHQLHAMQHRASHHIHHEKHDRQYRGF